MMTITYRYEAQADDGAWHAVNGFQRAAYSADGVPTRSVFDREVTLGNTVALMQQEVRHDAARGRVPRSVRSFAELHNYVDANEYGGFCNNEFADELIAIFGGRDEHEGMPDGFLDFMNDAQGAVDKWLREGGLR